MGWSFLSDFVLIAPHPALDGDFRGQQALQEPSVDREAWSGGRPPTRLEYDALFPFNYLPGLPWLGPALLLLLSLVLVLLSLSLLLLSLSLFFKATLLRGPDV